MSKPVIIYHNPRCAKSREALQLLRAQGIEPEVVEYMREPLRKAQLRELIELLGVEVRAVLRTGEAIYKEANLGDAGLSDEDLLAAIVKHPNLLQRPIVVKGKRAVIGRPPALVLRLLLK